MTGPIKLYGYRYSVYTRVAKVALHRKQLAFENVEIDPFSDLPKHYLALHPFGRVPVLMHGSFALHETGAITRYIDRTFPGDPLQPEDAGALARMDQVISIVDSYGYVPMVRQVFSHSVFRPLADEPFSEDEIARGLEASKPVLAALESLAAEGLVLTGGDAFTLADCHLAPMIDYFIRAEEGRRALLAFPNLSRWWKDVSVQPAMIETDPDLSKLGPG